MASEGASLLVESGEAPPGEAKGGGGWCGGGSGSGGEGDAKLESKRKAVFDDPKYANQIDVFDWYQSQKVQYCVAVIILLNFVIQIWKRQFDPGCAWEFEEASLECKGQNVWSLWTWFFNIVFLLELLWNFAGSFWKPFWHDNWNKFDVLVVGLGVLDMTGVPLGNLKLLRMLRAFRIFRLFGRIKSLRKIITSLFAAGAGVFNAFVIVMIVMCIYAVLAVDLWGNAMCNPDGTPMEKWDDISYHGEMCFGLGYFGSFSTAWYTMFQIMTGESWSEGVVWPLLDYYGGRPGSPGNHAVRFGVGVFFVSFVIFSQFILLNVVVTVLIDGMNQAVDETTDVDETKEEPTQVDSKPKILELLKKIQDDLDTVKKMV